MSIVLTIMAIIGIAVLAFVILGLLGWGVQILGLIGSFLGEGIAGCLGCFAKFFWVILLILVAIALLQ